MKKLIAIFFSIIFVLAFSVSAFADYNVLIDDGANLFTSDEIDYIDSVVSEFATETEFSVAVVTTDYAMDKSAMEYADDYYDNLIFNSGWSEDGMCFLIDMDNREIYVSCAGLAIDEYTDYELDTIVDNGYPNAASGDYADCATAMILTAKKLALSDEGEIYNGSDEFVPTYGEYYEDDFSSSIFNPSHVIVFILIGLVSGFIAVTSVKKNYKNTGIGDEYNADDVFLEVTASSDNVVSRNVVTTKIPKNNNNHRSGGGGGTYVHRSSGGVRHSGSGRKF